MSVFLTVTAATQLCAGCTLEFEPTDTLGAREDPAGVGMLADVLDLGNQGYLVSSDALGGVVIVYDSEGRYQRELTREGDGPGELRVEPRFAMGAGGIALWGGPRLHLYSQQPNCVPGAPWNSSQRIRWEQGRTPPAWGCLQTFSTWGTRGTS